MQSRPQIRFCTLGGGAKLAFAVQGSGPVMVIGPSHVSDLERDLDEPALAAFYDRLAARFTLVRYDHSGVGLSDRARDDFSFEREVRELKAVIDSVARGPVVLLAGSFGGPVAAALAARFPELVGRLVLYGSFAHGAKVAPPEVGQAIVELLRAHWGLGARMLTGIVAPNVDEAAAERRTRSQYGAASADTAAKLLALLYEMDVRELLPKIEAPTLVIHRRQDRSIPLDAGRDLAARIPFASMVTLEGQVHLPWFEGNGVLATILEFLQVEDAAPSVRESATEAELLRSGDVWSIAWAGNRRHLKHAKGLADIATLVQNPGTGIAALTLAEAAASTSSLALHALPMAVGYDMAPRAFPTDAERARKAVTARLRDAIARVRSVHPSLGEHLDGAITTGLTCAYRPAQAIRWRT